MKIKNISRYLACTVAACTLYACNDAEYSVIENGVYIGEAAPGDAFNQQRANLLVGTEAVELRLNIRMAAPVDQDVTVRLSTDESLIRQYNEANAGTFQLLPSQFMEMAETVTIPAGKTSAPTTTLTINPFTTPNNEQYAVPLRITVENSAVPTVGSSDKMLYLLTRPNIQKSIVLGGSSTETSFKSAIPADQWTFEYWIKVNNKTGQPIGTWEGEANRAFRARIFGDNSAPIFLDGDEQVLLRYWADGVKKTAPTLQCQLEGPYFDSSEFWWPDTWYHIAYTYDGSTLTLYKDGTADNSKQVDKKFNFNKLTLCAAFGWQMQVEFAQVRLWNKSLPANVIKDGMSRQIPADSEGLVGYWKCDEGEGRTLKDCTTNENHINLSSGTRSSWSEKEYDFSSPNPKE